MFALNTPDPSRDGPTDGDVKHMGAVMQRSDGHTLLCLENCPTVCHSVMI